jgi:hypothetical protein
MLSKDFIPTIALIPISPPEATARSSRFGKSRLDRIRSDRLDSYAERSAYSPGDWMNSATCSIAARI